MDIHNLKSLFKSTLFATSCSSSRYCFEAVRLETTDGITTAIATDGRHLVTAQHKTDLPDGELNIKSKSARTFCRLVALKSGEAKLDIIGDTMMLVSWTDRKGERRECKLEFETTRRFPDWKPVVANQDTVAELIGDLEDIKRWLAPIPSLQLSLNGKVRVGSPMKEATELEYLGEPIEIQFNPDMLSSWLNTLPKDSETVIKFTGNDSQIMGTCGSTRYALMPLS